MTNARGHVRDDRCSVEVEPIDLLALGAAEGAHIVVHTTARDSNSMLRIAGQVLREGDQLICVLDEVIADEAVRTVIVRLGDRR